MVIGEHKPVQAVNTTLKGALELQLDEALTGLEESFHDLSDEQLWSKPLPGRHNIATLVGHLVMSMDLYGAHPATGGMTMQHEDRFDIWRFSEADLRDKQDNLPATAEMLRRFRTLREAVVGYVRSAPDKDLLSQRNVPGWWRDRGATQLDAQMRLIGHVQAHVRQIWLMRGLMGLTDAAGWPQQHLA